jgi:hypothetical protein
MLLYLHPKQWADIQDNILALSTGIFQFIPASYEAMSAKGSHYKGQFLGVDIYTSSHITNDGTDHLGALFAVGAFGYAMVCQQPFLVQLKPWKWVKY